MALTIEMPDSAEVVISVLVIVAFLCGVWKFFPLSTPKTSGMELIRSPPHFDLLGTDMGQS